MNFVHGGTQVPASHEASTADESSTSSTVVAWLRRLSRRSHRTDVPFSAVLCDLDGTLLDSEKLWDIALQETLTWLGGPTMTPTMRQKTLGNSLDELVAHLFEFAGRTAEADGGTSADCPSVKETGDRVMGRMAELFTIGVPWRPGAKKFLTMLHSSGVPLALVTNTQRRLADVALETMGRRNFTVTVCGDEVARGKPAPDPYVRAAELLNVRPHDCLVIEDSATGADSANAAGARVVAIPSEAPVPEALQRVVVDSLAGISMEDLTHLWTSLSSSTADADGEASRAHGRMEPREDL